MSELLALLQLPFAQRAAIAILLIAVTTAITGLIMNLRGLEFFGDGLVHAVFPGVVLGYVLRGDEGIVPGSIIAALIATALLSYAARRIPGGGSDAATAVIMAGTFGLGIVLVSRLTDYATGLEQLLFGQLLTVTWGDIAAIAVLGALAVALIAFSWKGQLFVAFDRRGALAAGMRVTLVDLTLNLAIALVVVATSRAVGTLLVLAILIAPVATARIVSSRLGVVLGLAILVSAVTSLAGLLLSSALSLNARIAIAPSAVVVLLMVAVYLIAAATASALRAWRRRSLAMTPAAGPAAGAVATEAAAGRGGR